MRHLFSLHWHRGIRPIAGKVIQIELQEWFLEILTTVIFPLTYFVAFGLGLRNFIQDVGGYPYIVFLAPGLIALTVLMEAYQIGAWGMWNDRWHQQMIEEFRIKPITTSDIIIGHMLGSFLIAILKGVITGVILVMLSPIPVPLHGAMPFMVYMIFGCILFCALGTMVGVTFRKPDHIAKSQVLVITPLLYLGGLFFPITAFPQWLQPIIQWIPTTALFDGSRDAFLKGLIHPQYLLVIVVSAAIGFVASVWWFNRKIAE